MAKSSKNKAIGDSGAISVYRPAEHTKPPRLLDRISNAIKAFKQYPDFDASTELGSMAASPATYAMSLWSQRMERAQYISDCRKLLLDDPRAAKACKMYVREAMRDGVRIRVQGESRLEKRAQKIWNETVAPIMPAVDLEGWALMLIVEGDLFVQAVIGDDEQLIDFARRPAAGMERCTDDADRFIDLDKAFGQIDTMSWQNVAYFPLTSMCHVRWNYIDGDKYGTPEILPVRRMFRQLELLEAAKLTQAMTRSPLRYHWKVGTPDNPASPDEVKDVMAANGFVEGERQIFDPTEQSRDMFTNGVSEIDVLEGDQNLHHIDHIRYFQDVYAVGLPTPRALMNLGAENVNRDILGQLRIEWLKDTLRVNQAMEELVRWGFELALMLDGIDPSLLTYEIMWSKSTTETEKDRIESVIAMREANLVTTKTAITMLQPYTRIPSVDAEMEELDKETESTTQREERKRAAGATQKDKLDDEGITTERRVLTKRRVPSNVN